MRTRQKCVATDTWRSLGWRTTPLEHWSRRKSVNAGTKGDFLVQWYLHICYCTRIRKSHYRRLNLFYQVMFQPFMSIINTLVKTIQVQTHAFKFCHLYPFYFEQIMQPFVLSRKAGFKAIYAQHALTNRTLWLIMVHLVYIKFNKFWIWINT